MNISVYANHMRENRMPKLFKTQLHQMSEKILEEVMLHHIQIIIF